MKTVHASIVINAPKEKVWKAMLEDKTYREWTTAFHAGSHFVGSWDQGSEIRFLGPNEDGTMGGMVGRIKENRPYEFVSIEYVGEIMNGKVDTTSEHAKAWIGGHENYAFAEKDGKTEVVVDTDTTEEMVNIFEDMWPQALKKLKEVAER